MWFKFPVLPLTCCVTEQVASFFCTAFPPLSQGMMVFDSDLIFMKHSRIPGRKAPHIEESVVRWFKGPVSTDSFKSISVFGKMGAASHDAQGRERDEKWTGSFSLREATCAACRYSPSHAVHWDGADIGEGRIWLTNDYKWSLIQSPRKVKSSHDLWIVL